MIEVLTQLRVLYVQSGKSQQTIAENTGHSKPTISNILSGKSEDVRLQTVIDIAEELGADLALVTEQSRKAISQQDISFYRDEIAARETDLETLRNENAKLRGAFDTEIARLRSEHTDEVKFYREQLALLRDQLTRKDRYIDLVVEIAKKGGDMKSLESAKGVE